MEPIIPHYIAGKGALAQKKLIDKASEKGLLDEMDFEYVDGRVLPTEETVQKIDPYKTPKQKEMEASMEKGVPGGGDPKMWAAKKTIDRNQQRKDDIKLAYEDLLPMFKEELGADPENVKKQSWLALAKWGQGMLAEPGGDIVGAAGKAADTAPFNPSAISSARVLISLNASAILPTISPNPKNEAKN